MVKKKAIFDQLSEIASKVPKVPQVTPKDVFSYTQKYGVLPSDDYDYETALRVGIKPIAWIDLPEEMKYEDVAEELSGIRKFPMEEAEFLKNLSPILHERVFNIFDNYMKTRPPVYFWPDVFKKRR
jgi:hypothetical protein